MTVDHDHGCLKFHYCSRPQLLEYKCNTVIVVRRSGPWATPSVIAPVCHPFGHLLSSAVTLCYCCSVQRLYHPLEHLLSSVVRGLYYTSKHVLSSVVQGLYYPSKHLLSSAVQGLYYSPSKQLLSSVVMAVYHSFDHIPSCVVTLCFDASVCRSCITLLIMCCKL